MLKTWHLKSVKPVILFRRAPRPPNALQPDAGSWQWFDERVRNSISTDKNGAQVRLSSSFSLVHSPLSFYLVTCHYDNRKTAFHLYIDDTVFVVVMLEMDLGMKKLVNLSVCASSNSVYHSSPWEGWSLPDPRGRWTSKNRLVILGQVILSPWPTQDLHCVFVNMA